MRNPLSLLASLVFAAGLSAQEPPILTSPPVQTAQFGAAAFGGGVTQVAQLSFLFIPGSSPRQWYVTATVRSPASAFFHGWSGTATTTTAGGPYTLVANSDLVNVPPPTVDYFAFNVSADLKVLVFDTGPSTGPAVYVRTNTSGPFLPFGTIGTPVPVGYRDSQLGNTISSWNGTGGAYEYIYVTATNDLAKVPFRLIAPGTVAVIGTPVAIATSPTAKHSPSPLRQWTGSPAGTARALLFSHNISSADSWFRASLDDDMVNPSPLHQIYDDASWKANPGHIGGSTYWAYAPTGTYQNPLQEDVCAMNSATVPAAGGIVTLCGWAPPGPSPHFGFLMVGNLQSPGINLSFLGIQGLLGITPASLIILPVQPIDPFLGETCWTFLMPPAPPCTSLDLQFGCLETPPTAVKLGNNIVIKAS